MNLSGFTIFSQPKSIHSGSDHYDGNFTRKTFLLRCVPACALKVANVEKADRFSDLVPAVFP